MNTGQHNAVGVSRGLALVMDAEFTPPKHSADYEAKPLPAVPPRTSFSIPDLKAAFKTSKRNLSNKQYVYDWDRQGDNISLTTTGRSETPRSRSLPENDGSSIPTTPSNEILSPQPRHSRQKILRLTGNISPSMSLASLTPSLHNSQQKIKQITGLDVGSSSSSESQPDELRYPFQDEVSPVSPTSSTYSREGLEATISEPDSDASDYTLHSDFNGVTTQLTARPSFSASSSRPISATPSSPTTRFRLNSFAFREPDTSSQGGSLTDFKAHYRQGSNTGSWDSSRKSSVTVVPHYTSGGDTFKSSPRASQSTSSIVDTGPPSPSFKQRSLVWDASPAEHLTSSGQDDPSPTSSPLPSSSSTSVNHKPGSFSDRRASSRGRVPTPLEPNAELPLKPGRFGHPQRTPYPPPPPPPSASTTRSAFDTDSDDGKRTSFLAKVFGGSGGGGGSGNSSKRQSRGPTPSSSPSPFGEQGFVPGGPKATPPPPLPPPPVLDSPGWSQGPDVLRSPTETSGSAGVGAGRPPSAGAGLFQRARQSVGLRSKSDKRRDTLRGKIRVVET